MSYPMNMLFNKFILKLLKFLEEKGQKYISVCKSTTKKLNANNIKKILLATKDIDKTEYDAIITKKLKIKQLQKKN